MIPDPVCNNTDTRSSQPNLTCLTPDSTYPLIIFHIILIFIPQLSLSGPELYHHRRTQSYVIPPYLCMSWSWVDTEYSIHWVQHTPKIDCLHFIFMITSWLLNVVSALGGPPYRIDRHQPALHKSTTLKSLCHIPTVPSSVTDKQSLSTRRTFHPLPPITRPNSHNHSHQMHLQTRTIALSKLARSRPPSVSLNSLDYGPQVCTITASKYISLNSLDHVVQLYLHTGSIFASKRLPCSHDHALQVYLHTRLTTAS